MIKIKEISIAGWKSYDEKGVHLSELKDFNIIIGPNNTGKSNLIHYLMYIYYDFSFYVPYKEWLDQLKENYKEENSWNLLGGNISSSIVVEDLENEKVWTLEVIHPKNTEAKFKASLQQGEEVKNFEENSKASYECWKMLMDKFDHIVPQRDYNRFANDSTIGFDGSQLISYFDKLKPEEFSGLSNDLTTYLTDILGEQTMVKKIEVLPNLDVNPDRYFSKNKAKQNLDGRDSEGAHFPDVADLEEMAEKEQKIQIIIEQGRNEKIPLNLNDLGTGITQVIIILCFLWLRAKIHGHKNLILFIEEPECNLHNDTLIRFMKLLENKFQYQFFVTTHSNALLDYFSTRSSAVYRVQKTSGGASRFSPCLRNLDKFHLLDDLGVTASQLLLSNCVIWIEGPTDRIYLKKWIETRSNLRENEHFIFAMYGGKNLYHYTLMDAEDHKDWIKILKSSRYVAIIADSDGTSELQQEKENTAIQRIKNELNTSRELDDFCYIWATKNVKEIENYVPYDLLSQAIEELHKVRKYERDTGLLKKNINLYESFGKYFANMYTGKNGQALNEDEERNVYNAIVKLKVPIAHYVSDNWKQEFVEQNEELKERLEGLINHIEMANRIKI
ncbi:ATP-dependent nuclease [Bacillus sp. FF-1]|uniref:ATP-dependent nuclease n=1 Tax=Bacillus sp. FF-1 TaxID=3025192 RepID=UPI00234E452C|nr:ATP-binding protein [Bacillus sp. FF-1]MDC7739530.1 ATP-binding protein [Bacillus sp. FF-1]